MEPSWYQNQLTQSKFGGLVSTLMLNQTNIITLNYKFGEFEICVYWFLNFSKSYIGLNFWLGLKPFHLKNVS